MTTTKHFCETCGNEIGDEGYCAEHPADMVVSSPVADPMDGVEAEVERPAVDDLADVEVEDDAALLAAQVDRDGGWDETRGDHDPARWAVVETSGAWGVLSTGDGEPPDLDGGYRSELLARDAMGLSVDEYDLHQQEVSPDNEI